LREAFAASGTVDTVNLITDRDTGQSKGFAFIEMASEKEAQTATQELSRVGVQPAGRQAPSRRPSPGSAATGGPCKKIRLDFAKRRTVRGSNPIASSKSAGMVPTSS
jgi:RNA recognition motif-containing protein